jgi:diacylglycerol kinase family enzyme
MAPRVWLRFLRAVMRGAARARAPRTLMRIDGREIEMRLASITISVNPLDISAGHLFSRQSLEAGSLAIYGVRHLGLADMLRLGVRALIGRVEDDSEIHVQSARSVDILRIGRRPRRTIRVMNDGEVSLVPPPLRYRVIPGHLRVMAPRQPEA